MTRWPLRGGARASYVVSWVIGAFLLLAGPAVAVLLWHAPGSAAALIPGVILFGIGVLIASQLLRCAVVVTLEPDGTLLLGRPLGAVSTHVSRVRSARPSRLNRSGARTPTVLVTDDGAVLLAHDRHDVAAILAALGLP